MNIVIVGAGAIGSLFGALLSKKNTVVLLARNQHATAIQQNGLTIIGKTRLHTKVFATDSPSDITFSPDLLVLTVKSYDTETAIRQIKTLIQDKTIVVSLQNGLDNIEKIQHIVDQKKLLAGVTTHGAIFSSPGIITHTGKGNTILGELDGSSSDRLQKIVAVFHEAGISIQVSDNVIQELWAKAIINSSINPLTAFLNCKNGYLLTNPLLEKIVEAICEESTRIAQAEGHPFTTDGMIRRTKQVIRNTAKNSSSMLQSIQQGKKTEIDAINGRLAALGKHHGLKTSFNSILVDLVTSLTKT